MRRKYTLYILFLLIIWFLIILEFNKTLFHRFNNENNDNIGSQEMKIKYFTKMYKKSISEDENNHYGEMGKKVVNLDSEKEESEQRFSLHQFNELASSKIPFLRKLPEKRRASCFERKYDVNLPAASIIIIYHNEAFSTLVRTVHTALSRSPVVFIKEILLVDDNSDYDKCPHLLKELDDHFKHLPIVKIIRSEKRIGLTKARLLGARFATGEVLVFLDSHCECWEGWLEPLLDDIKKYPRRAITPIIEIIDMDDMSITSNVLSFVSVGSFTWKADFTWIAPKHQDQSANIVKSPTMAGGLFAIGRKFFFESGSYDEDMTYWGGENIEISFRLWMCAEGIYTDPCSIVGHIFRKNSPHNLPPNSVFFNKLRAVEVWMDDYKKFVYRRIGIHAYDSRAGSLETRIKLRKDLKCKDFEWYLTEVANHIRKPGKPTNLKNPHTNKCIDTQNNKESDRTVQINTCHSVEGDQAIEVDREGLIFFDELCLDLAHGYVGALPTFYKCHFQGGNQKWLFVEPGLIKHHITDLCLKINEINNTLSTDNCRIDDPLQIFTYSFSN